MPTPHHKGSRRAPKKPDADKPIPLEQQAKTWNNTECAAAVCAKMREVVAYNLQGPPSEYDGKRMFILEKAGNLIAQYTNIARDEVIGEGNELSTYVINIPGLTATLSTEPPK